MVQNFKILRHVYRCFYLSQGFKEEHENLRNPLKIKIIFFLSGRGQGKSGAAVYIRSSVTSVLDVGQWWDLLIGRIAPPPSPRHGKTVPVPIEEEAPQAP